MAHRHRPGDAGAVFANHAAAARALSRYRPGLQPANGAHGLSGIAVDYTGVAATAGPPHRMRGRTDRTQAPDRRAAPRHPGPGRRPRWLGRAAGLRAAEGTARPGRDRPTL